MWWLNCLFKSEIVHKNVRDKWRNECFCSTMAHRRHMWRAFSQANVIKINSSPYWTLPSHLNRFHSVVSTDPVCPTLLMLIAALIHYQQILNGIFPIYILLLVYRLFLKCTDKLHDVIPGLNTNINFCKSIRSFILGFGLCISVQCFYKWNYNLKTTENILFVTNIM